MNSQGEVLMRTTHDFIFALSRDIKGTSLLEGTLATGYEVALYIKLSHTEFPILLSYQILKPPEKK